MKWTVTVVLCACALLGSEVNAGKFGKFGGFGKTGGRKSPSPPRRDPYPKQKYEPHAPTYQAPTNHAPDPRPPPYNPTYGGPPPPYSKNPPAYPQHGGNAPPPAYNPGWNAGGGSNPSYGWNVGQGSKPGWNTGYQPPHSYQPPAAGGYGSYNPTYSANPAGGFNYPHPSYNYDYKPKSKFPSIIPIPIPIPLGGGGFGYPGGYRGYGAFSGWRPNSDRGSSSGSSASKNADPSDPESAPRVLAPPDGELDGVTELPTESKVPQWTIFAHPTDMKIDKYDD